MGIIPKNGEQKESVGIVSVIIAHYILGIGIAVLGQRTKNVAEFWGGIIIFILAVGLLLFFVSAAGSVESFRTSLSGVLYTLFSLMTWLYVLLRFVWIYVKKETKLTLL